MKAIHGKLNHKPQERYRHHIRAKPSIGRQGQRKRCRPQVRNRKNNINHERKRKKSSVNEYYTCPKRALWVHTILNNHVYNREEGKFVGNV
jgi:hypothetical protein